MHLSESAEAIYLMLLLSGLFAGTVDSASGYGSFDAYASGP